MENEDDYGIGINPYREIRTKLEPDFNGSPDNKDIVIPPTFKDVVVKMCPEIVDIVSMGYREHMVYNPMNFEPVYTYLVGG